jgi:hypothetical protein
MKKAAARVPTLLLCAMMGVGGVIDLLRPPAVRELIAHLGYPPWFPLMLGVAKLLGVIALFLPGRIREWAYAGFAIDLVAAVISHLAVGDGAKDVAPALVGLVLLGTSYAFRTTSGAGS